MRKVWDIPGGVHPPENKIQSLQVETAEVSLPKQLILPLNQHIGAPAKPIVAVGDRVLKGQLIAEASGFVSASLHAPTSGTITAIEEQALPHPSGLSGTCIVLDSDGQDKWGELAPCEDYTALEREALLAKIRNAGISGMGGAGFPASVKLDARKPIDTLILNGTECEPYITADDVLMREQAEKIIEGAQILSHLLGNPDSVLVGIEDNKPQAIERMQQAATGTQVEIVVFPTKYPSGGEKQLIQILTGTEVPSGGLPADLGIVVQNVGTAAAIRDAVIEGKPLISRITTVVGEALQTQRNVEVLIGTPISHLLAEHGFDPSAAARLIMGGPMMGFALDNAEVPLVKTSNCILVPSHSEMPAPPPSQACIRCGMCAEACPANLLPQQLYWYAQAEDHDKLMAHNLMDCIECGACSFVCPSTIPLVQYYRAAKGSIRQKQEDKIKADHARKRFEFRQERLAKAEAEKLAKREARKKAAEEAKKLAAEKAAAGESAPKADGKADLVAAALARTQAKKADPAQQEAKLSRAVTSSKERVAKLKEKLATAEQETPDQVEKIQAQIKNAEIRLQDAQQKLEQRKATAQTAAPDSTTAAAITATTNSGEPKDAAAAAIERAMAKASMSPEEKLRSNIESLTNRLEKAEKKAADAKAEGSEHADAFAANAEKLKTKIADAQKELAEIAPQAAVSQENSQEPAQAKSEPLDAAAAAIERAKAKANMSPEEKLRSTIESLSNRLVKAEKKAADAKAEGNEHADAFAANAEKLKTKLADAKKELAEIAPESAQETIQEPTPEQQPESSPTPPQEQDAASAAIERAKAKAEAMAAMSPEDKLRSQIQSMEQRLEKNRDKLAKAEAEGADHVDALRTGVEKLEQKLEAAKAELNT